MKKNTKVKQVTVLVPLELWQRTKILAIERDKTLQAFVVDALTKATTD